MKICSGRFSAGLGAAVSCRGLMIGGGGSTAKRAATEVNGGDAAACTAAEAAALGGVPAEAWTGAWAGVAWAA